MTEAQKVGEDEKPKEVIAKKVRGTVKWFNVKSGYGFIIRNDTEEDVFVPPDRHRQEQSQESQKVTW